ncbi:hypothetical protein [Methanosarcina sp. DH1]|uniref:hypothetical protein n=1 Tax=Methanosarcina sp. DH1 TaxID=2605695 RepID=UPI001E5FDDEB|nr:hypothetical protein [Methanosarcina sp. DH1]
MTQFEKDKRVISIILVFGQKTELFKVVNIPMQDTIEKFVELATVTAEYQKRTLYRPCRKRCISIFSLAVDNVYAYFAHGFRKQGKSTTHI